MNEDQSIIFLLNKFKENALQDIKNERVSITAKKAKINNVETNYELKLLNAIKDLDCDDFLNIHIHIQILTTLIDILKQKIFFAQRFKPKIKQIFASIGDYYLKCMMNGKLLESNSIVSVFLVLLSWIGCIDLESNINFLIDTVCIEIKRNSELDMNDIFESSNEYSFESDKNIVFDSSKNDAVSSEESYMHEFKDGNQLTNERTDTIRSDKEKIFELNLDNSVNSEYNNSLNSSIDNSFGSDNYDSLDPTSKNLINLDKKTFCNSNAIVIPHSYNNNTFGQEKNDLTAESKTNSTKIIDLKFKSICNIYQLLKFSVGYKNTSELAIMYSSISSKFIKKIDLNLSEIDKLFRKTIELTAIEKNQTRKCKLVECIINVMIALTETCLIEEFSELNTLFVNALSRMINLKIKGTTKNTLYMFLSNTKIFPSNSDETDVSDLYFNKLNEEASKNNNENEYLHIILTAGNGAIFNELLKILAFKNADVFLEQIKDDFDDKEIFVSPEIKDKILFISDLINLVILDIEVVIKYFIKNDEEEQSWVCSNDNSNFINNLSFYLSNSISSLSILIETNNKLGSKLATGLEQRLLNILSWFLYHPLEVLASSMDLFLEIENHTKFNEILIEKMGQKPHKCLFINQLFLSSKYDFIENLLVLLFHAAGFKTPLGFIIIVDNDSSIQINELFKPLIHSYTILLTAWSKILFKINISLPNIQKIITQIQYIINLFSICNQVFYE